MAIQAGLVGLPNVGKSTLFNALTKSSIPAENYPFCTVDPNKAITYVPDERLDRLATIFKSQKTLPTTVSFVDIAGLVKGASQGEGLGNQFLGHIMDVDLVLHVLRCFESDDITHVNNRIDPLSDYETICTELMLKDLESIEKRDERLHAFLKKAKNSPTPAQQIKEWEQEQVYNAKLKAAINAYDHEGFRSLVAQAKKENIPLVPLLSGKNFLIIANVSEDDYVGDAFEKNEHYCALVKHFGEARVIPVSAKIESELAQLPVSEAQEFMKSLGIEHKGLDTIIQKAYVHLGLITFFTCGPKEAHGWQLRKNTAVPQAAGEIHSDLERGFICAEVYNCQDLFTFGTEQELKTRGKIRTEGKDYIVTDGDVLVIKFNV
jgi:GTP-binding protein YchF